MTGRQQYSSQTLETLKKRINLVSQLTFHAAEKVSAIVYSPRLTSNQDILLLQTETILTSNGHLDLSKYPRRGTSRKQYEVIIPIKSLSAIKFPCSYQEKEEIGKINLCNNYSKRVTLIPNRTLPFSLILNAVQEGNGLMFYHGSFSVKPNRDKQDWFFSSWKCFRDHIVL